MHTEQPTGRAALTLSYVVAGGANLVFHVLAANLTDGTQYGTFAAVAATLAVLSIPLGAMEVSLASSAARLGRRLGVDETLRRTSRALAIPVVLLSAVALPAARAGLSVSWVEAAAVALFLPTAVVLTAAKALLIGSRSYRQASITVMLTPAVRIVAIAGLALVGNLGAVGLTLATLMAECAAVAYGTLALRALPERGQAAAFDLSRLGAAAAALVPVAALAGSDVLVARAALAPEAAGRIAAAANLAKGALYLPQALATASLPDLAAAPARRASTLVLRAATLMVGLVLAGLLVIAAAGSLVTDLLLGDPTLGGVLPWLATAAAAVGLTQLSTTMLLARDARTAPFAWVGLPVIVIVTPLLGDTTSVLVALNATCWTTAALGLVLVARHRDTIGADQATAPGRLTRSLTVVLPAFRPGAGFEQHVARVAAIARDVAPSCEILVVDDGCPELAGDRAEALGIAELVVARHERNRGKGQALRTGFAAATGEIVVFIDADGDIPAEHVHDLAYRVERGADVVVADKTHPGSDVEWSLARRLFTFGWGTVVQARHGLPVADTQVGAKAFRGELTRSLAAVSRVDGFAVDLELLTHAHRWGARIDAAPVRIRRVAETSMRPPDVLRMLATALRSVPRRDRPGDRQAPATADARDSRPVPA